MALTAGKTWTMTAWTGYYPGYGEMHVVWTFQQYYDPIGNYSQIYLTNIQCYHTSGSTAGLWVTSQLSGFGGEFGAYGSLGGASINQGITYPVVSGERIYHDEQGNASVTMWADGRVSCQDLEFASELNGVSQGVDLFIPRASDISAANGTLGVEQVLTVTRKNAAYTHTITYTCGNTGGTVCTRSGAASISFTPPMELAAQNTAGTTVLVTFTLQTYSGDTPLGETRSVTAAMAIPESVKPTASNGWVTAVPENTGAVSGLSCYVQGYSRAVVSFDAGKITMAYGAQIAGYAVSCGGETVHAAPFRTAALHASGAVELKCTVTDTRGRSFTDTLVIQVEPYAKPVLTDIQVYRSNSAGGGDDTGLYIAVRASAVISSLNGENTKTLQARYKVSTGSYGGYQPIADGVLQVIGNGGIAITNSYTAEVLLTDRLGNTAVYTGIIPTESVFFSGREGGGAAGFGKHAESDDLLDVAWNLRARKNLHVDGALSVGDRVAGMNNLTFLGVNPVASTADDTTITWANLGSGYGWYNVLGCLTNQPQQHGFLLNIVHRDYDDVVQIFFNAHNGMTFRRSGNRDGWASYWTRMVTDVEAWPVGSIYMSMNAASPASLFGGGWEPITDHFLLASGWNAAGSMGGSASVMLTQSHMHESVFADTAFQQYGVWGTNYMITNSTYAISTLKTRGIAQTAVDKMPPYLVVYMWRRVW